jgi:hypothetical protein
MGDILNASGSKVASIKSSDSGLIVAGGGKVFGRVHGSEVWDMSRKVGHFDSSGRVYQGPTPVGIVDGHGQVRDNSNSYRGSVKGDNIIAGGAALLLIITT